MHRLQKVKVELYYRNKV